MELLNRSTQLACLSFKACLWRRFVRAADAQRWAGAINTCLCRTIWKVIPAMSNNKDNKEKAQVKKKMERLRNLDDRNFEIWSWIYE